MNKKAIIQYLKENKLNIQSAYAALFPLDLVYTAYVNSDQIHGVNFSPVFCYLSFQELSSFYQIIPQKNIDQIADRIYQDYLENPQTLKDKIQKHLQLTQDIEKIWQVYQSRDKLKLSSKNLLVTYKKLVDIGFKWWQYGAIGEDKGGIIEKKIIPNFVQRHRWHEVKARKVVSILSHPKKQSVFMQERKDFLNLVLSFLKDKSLKKNLEQSRLQKISYDQKIISPINAYIKKYFWIKTNFYQAKHITPKSLLKEIKQAIATKSCLEILEELKNIEENFQKIQKQKSKLLSKLKFSKQDHKDIDFAQANILWIDIRKIEMMKVFYYLFSLLEDITEKFNLSYHDLILHTIKEVEDLLKTNKEIGGWEKKRRNRSLMMIFERRKRVKMFYGKEAWRMFETTFPSSQKEVQGTVACSGKRGKITGCVRIVFNPLENQFLEGEILVTSMTRIEFVPLMRKAKAIITDEGGLACHAAIVSRELDIPCIIGTKIATKVLKDGDLVEVDASQGVVRILGKGNKSRVDTKLDEMIN